jgi:LAO/AO transport system kinase
VESSRAEDRPAAEALVAALPPRAEKALRLGISGAPGVGKSTFIEAFGLALVATGHRVAVLAVDPTSQRGGGSILGDKTRMPELAKSERAFIRPSPSGKRLGGVTRRTREAIAVAEAAGFDRIIVETVGIGQAETEIADMVDLFLLLLAPGGGDDLQGIKRGIMELADLILVNKADGALEAAAGRTAADYTHALRLMQPRFRAWNAEVLQISALTGAGIAKVGEKAEAFRAALEKSGELAARRRDQAGLWFNRELGLTVIERLSADAVLSQQLATLEAKVRTGEVAPGTAARQVLDAWLK